jgi:hypothetical protein
MHVNLPRRMAAETSGTAMLDDPAVAAGDEEARLNVFRRVRDEIENRLREFENQVESERL